MIKMGLLLEEEADWLDFRLQEEQEAKAKQYRCDGVALAKIHRIEYKHPDGAKTWNCVAHGWDWDDRHKKFYLIKPEGGKEYIASFFCLPADFISHQERGLV